MPCSPSDGNPIRTLAVYSRGFISGGDNAAVRIFELAEDGEYSVLKTLKIHKHENARVCSIAISPTEDQAVVTTSDCQMFTLMLDNLEMMKETDMNFTLTVSSFHGPAPTTTSNSSGSANAEGEKDSCDAGNNAENVKINAPVPAQITGMDTCSRKPLLVTCGVDRSVRVWNYVTKKCELVNYFADEPCSISMHPSGLHVLVGFR